MNNFLEKIRSKDDSQKVMIAFVAAIVITGVIVTTWLTAIRISNKEEVAEEVAPKKADEVTPISNIGSQVSEIKSMFTDLKEQFSTSKEIINAIPEIVEESEIQQNTEIQTNISVSSSTATTTVNSTTTTEIESSSE